VRLLRKVQILALAVCFFLLPNGAWAGALVAVFPLQELGAGRNEVDLPFTRILSKGLAENGNEIVSLGTVISFMAHNRIRTVGRLETFLFSRVREDLGAAFVLLGTVTQKKEGPEPSMALTLSLVRTNDARTVWSYVGSFSTSDERRMLGIGEPKTVADLEDMLLGDIDDHWPWEIINEIQQEGSISIDSMVLEPTQVRPGGEISAQVRLRNVWSAGHAPRVFFKADDQLYPAAASDDGQSYKATWVTGEKIGSLPVTLVLEWPLYGRTESTLLGNFVVDGTPPLFEIDLMGARLKNGIPIFRRELEILPKPIVRKPLDRWRLSFFDDESGRLVGAHDGSGNFPERILWKGRGTEGSLQDGTYRVELEAWDKAGNSAKASRKVELNRSSPGVNMAVAKSDEGMVVKLQDDGRVPLASWRMEMWTKEGKLITQAAGEDLPAQVGVELPAAAQAQDIQGVLLVQDIFGNQVRRKVEDLLPKAAPKTEAEDKDKKPAGLSKSWVDEF
jgi:hypothetical protein